MSRPLPAPPGGRGGPPPLPTKPQEVRILSQHFTQAPDFNEEEGGFGGYDYYEESEDEYVIPALPPRTPPTKIRKNIENIPELPWREPLPEELVSEPSPREQFITRELPTPVSSDSGPKIRQIPAKLPPSVPAAPKPQPSAPEAPKPQLNIPTAPRPQPVIEESQIVQKTAENSQNSEKNSENLEKNSNNPAKIIKSTGGANYGLTDEEKNLDALEQANILSFKLNEVSESLTSTLQLRREYERILTTIERDSKDEILKIIVETDAKIEFYNNQTELLMQQLEEVKVKLREENTIQLPAEATQKTERGIRIERYQAIREFKSENKKKLSYHANDVITIIDKFPTGWWKGELNGCIGFFEEKNVAPCEDSFILPPALPTTSAPTFTYSAKPNFVPMSSTNIKPSQKYQDEVKSRTSSYIPSSSVKSSFESNKPKDDQDIRFAQPSQTQSAFVLYNFDKVNQSELAVTRGETVTVLKVIDCWTHARGKNGEGYVPTNYLQMLNN